MTRPRKLSLERYARSLGDVTQIVKDWQDHRDTFLAPQSFRFSLRIAWN